MFVSFFHSVLHGSSVPTLRPEVGKRLSVSTAGNPPNAHNEARYDTSALQAREAAGDSAAAWENPAGNATNCWRLYGAAF